jgi:hypothetical protein
MKNSILLFVLLSMALATTITACTKNDGSVITAIPPKSKTVVGYEGSTPTVIPPKIPVKPY